MTFLSNLLYLLFHGAMVGVGMHYKAEERCKLSGVPFFLMASGALHVACLVLGLASSARSGGKGGALASVPPLLVVASVLSGGRLVTLNLSRWNSSDPTDDGFCELAPMAAAHLSMAVQTVLLVLAVFKVISLVLAAVLLMAVAAGILSSTNFPTIAAVSSVFQGNPEFYPHSLNPADIL